jgi:hypothetical protein
MMMIDQWLQEPIRQLLEQWPTVGILVGVLWLLRRDMKECLANYRSLVDRLLERE